MRECIRELLKSNFLEEFFKKLKKENIKKVVIFSQEIEKFLELICILYLLSDEKIRIGVLTKLPYRFLGFPNVYQIFGFPIDPEQKENFEIIFFDDSIDSDLVDFSFANFYFYYGNKNLGMNQIIITNNVVKVVDEYFTIPILLPMVSRSILNYRKNFTNRVYDLVGSYATYSSDERKLNWDYGSKSELVKFLLGKNSKLAGNVAKNLAQALAAIEDCLANNALILG